MERTSDEENKIVSRAPSSLSYGQSNWAGREAIFRERMARDKTAADNAAYARERAQQAATSSEVAGPSVVGREVVIQTVRSLPQGE